MIAYAQARKIFYLAAINQEFEYSVEDGTQVRNALKKVKQRSQNTTRSFKTVSTPSKIIIWKASE